MTIVTPPPAIDRDRYGRPLVTPPNGGKPVAYSRCTSYIDVLEDKFNLQKWMQRMVALGLASRPDLLLSVAAHKDDKGQLDRICTDAREAAAASAAATTGTALHALTELVDRGETLPFLPDQAQADLDSYRLATGDLAHVLIEQFCVLDTLKIGGTPDRVVEYEGIRYIADIKTGSIEWGTLKIAMQLAVYSRSKTYDIASRKRGLHEADTSRGIIIHTPAGQGTTSLHWVDLEAGWYAVQVAKDVREKRALKFKDLTEPFGQSLQLSGVKAPGSSGNTAMLREKADIATAIRACTDADAVRTLWQTYEALWNEDLTKIAVAHINDLPATLAG